MNRWGRRWASSLLALVMLGHVGCAARGGVTEGVAAGRRRPDLRLTEPVGIVAGTDRVRVKRNGFVEAWIQEAGRCTRDTAGPVATQTLGAGLIVLPPVCGVMTAALPGMTTQFRGGRMRREIEAGLPAWDLQSKLRDRVTAALQTSGHRAMALAADSPDTGDAPVVPSPPTDLILEVTVTELHIRDDGTLASLVGRGRVLRAIDRLELAKETFTRNATDRTTWYAALKPALAALATAIVDKMAPPSAVDAEPATSFEVERPSTSAAPPVLESSEPDADDRRDVP